MSSIWSSNEEQFRQRFPSLAATLLASGGGEPSPYQPYQIEQAKNGLPTARDGGMLLHSRYDPQKEAQSLIGSFDPNTHEVAVFLGFGLGYAPLEFARAFPNAPMVLVESDTTRFLAALQVVDWSEVFCHEKLVLAVGAKLGELESILSSYSPQKIAVFKTKAQTAHDELYFREVEELINKSKTRDDVNQNTLEKFSHLWLKNSLKNLHLMKTLGGIQKYRNAAGGLPFVVFGAGPSLQSLLPHVRQIKRRAITVCVDASLGTFLQSGVEPDFVIVCDPQYWCARYLDFLACPTSALIAEIAAYPSVLRFGCREVLLFSSLFPIGQYFEKRLGQKGSLAAGGSVATTAWDFALFCGVREIFLAAVDLGFPGSLTHAKGCRAQESFFCQSSRLCPAEAQSTKSLLSAGSLWGVDYEGRPIRSDKKMSLFASWFESHCARAAQAGTVTRSLTPQSLAVRGVECSCVDHLLARDDATGSREEFFARAKENEWQQRERQGDYALTFDKVHEEFLRNLHTLASFCREGLGLCKKALAQGKATSAILRRLDEIDRAISSSDAKEAAALVFPSKRRFGELERKVSGRGELQAIELSKLIYEELLKALAFFDCLR